jgi:predicted hotdog family 3-hydroxylacyl-ACP dehydratase
MTLARRFAMTEVLPHRGRMVLLDELLEYDAERVICAVTIHEDTLFCDGANGVPSWVGIEYMAQTASAYAGVAEASDGLPASICLLLGARRYRAESPYFAIGSRLRIVAELLLRDENDLAAFDCTIYSDRGRGESVIARGDIKAYRPKDVHAVVRGDRI